MVLELGQSNRAGASDDRQFGVRGAVLARFHTGVFAVALSVGLSAALGGCSLPRGGPYYEEVRAAPSADLGFEVVEVTPQVAAAVRIDERSGFSLDFVAAAPEPVALIGHGDELVVTVWENLEEGLLSPQGIGATSLPRMKVDERGDIYVPYVGTVRAEGRTLDQLRNVIRARLAEQTLNPQVDVFPAGAVSRQVSLQGRIRSPGLYQIEPQTQRLAAMLARAGGVSEDPEVIRIRLRRGEALGEVWLQDLYDDPRNNVALRSDDIVIAERDRRIFTALGAVRSPATVPFPTRDVSVVRALGTVGGLVDGAADPTGVFVFREEPAEIAGKLFPARSAAGAERVVYVLDLTQPGGMFLARDFMMRDGDTLYVTTAPFVQWMKILQSISPLVNFSGSVRTLGQF